MPKWPQTTASLAALFREVTKAPSLEKAAVDLQRHIGEHPEDWLAVRLLTRLAQ